MALVAVTNEIAHGIGSFVVAIEGAKRLDVMNIQGFTKLIFCNAAVPACISISTPGSATLLSPVATVVGFIAATPVWAIGAGRSIDFKPFAVALAGAESSVRALGRSRVDLFALFASSLICRWFPVLDVAGGLFGAALSTAIFARPRSEVGEFFAALWAICDDSLGRVAAAFVRACFERATDVVGEFFAADRTGFGDITLWFFGSTRTTSSGTVAPSARCLTSELFAAGFASACDFLRCSPAFRRTIELVLVSPGCKCVATLNAGFRDLCIGARHVMFRS